MRILLPSLLILAAGCTPTARDLDRQAQAQAGDQAALDKELAGLVPGRPQDCIDQLRIRGSHTYGDTVVYEGLGGTQRYVSHTSGGCNTNGDNSFLVTRTPTTLLCRGDIAQAVDRTSRFPVGSCSFGQFIPYNRP